MEKGQNTLSEAISARKTTLKTWARRTKQDTVEREKMAKEGPDLTGHSHFEGGFFGTTRLPGGE